MGYAAQGMAGEIRQDKEFPFSKEAVVAAYNDTMQKIANVRPLDPSKEVRGNAGEYAGVLSYVLTPNVAFIFYVLTPNVVVLFEMNKDGGNPTHVKAIGIDEDDETRALIVHNCLALIAAVTPGWEGDERGAVAKELGITTRFPAFGSAKSLSYGGRDFHFANNGEYGMTLTISPTVPQ